MANSTGTSQVLFVMALEQEYLTELRKRIEPLLTGVGVVAAATTVTRALQELKEGNRLPRYIVSLGSAASATKRVGSVWQISEVSWRDIDASKLGFPKGVIPFSGLPPAIPLRTVQGIPLATLSTGSNFVGPDDFKAFRGDLADMETFAVVRACAAYSIPVIGIRGVSDGTDPVQSVDSWEDKLDMIDNALAGALDEIEPFLRLRK